MSSDSRSALKRLHKALKNRSFERAYFFHGDDDYLKDDMIRQVTAAAVEPAMRDFNLDVRRGGELSAEALDSALNTLPMMADRRLVIIRDVASMKKDVRAVLERYLGNPAPDTIVLLVATAGSKPDKVLEGKTCAIAFDPLTGDRIPRWITHYVSEHLQLSIADDAALTLQSAVGDDLPQLAAELEKLASYVQGRGESPTITDDDVRDIVGVRRGETMGDLLDRVGLRDAPGALAIVDHVLMQPKMSGVTIVMALSAQTLAIGWGVAARAEGMSPSRLEGSYFDLLKSGKGAFPGRPWGEAAKSWAKAVVSGRWTAQAVDDALEALLAADTALKETRVSSDEQIVEALILAMCVDQHVLTRKTA